MQTRVPIGSLAIALMLALFLADTSTANVQSFGDLPATKVDFRDVTESNLYIDGTTFFYGTPTVNVPADTLIPIFDNFAAQVDLGPRTAAVDSTLGMMIVAEPLQSFDTLYFSEHGEYRAAGVGNVDVRVAWFVDVLEVLDASGTRQTITPVNMNGETSKSYSAPADGQFGIEFQINMAPELTGITLPDGSTPTRVTRVNFRFDNFLEASADNADSMASIENSDIRMSTRVVPEPSSMGLGLLGLFGLMRVVRRRK